MTQQDMTTGRNQRDRSRNTIFFSLGFLIFPKIKQVIMKIISFIFLSLLLCTLFYDINAARNVRKKRGIFPSKTQIFSLLPAARVILKDVISVWKFSLEYPHLPIEGMLFTNEIQLLENIKEVSSKIAILEQNIASQGDRTISTLLQAFPTVLKLELKLHDLTSIINMINFAGDQLTAYIQLGYQNNTGIDKGKPSGSFYSVTDKGMSPAMQLAVETNNVALINPKSKIKRATISKRFVEKYTLLDFATWATGHTFNSLPSLLRRLNDLTVDETSKGIFSLMQETFQESQANTCNLKESPHQIIYNLYVRIALTELKGNALLQFSYMILKMYNKGEFTDEPKIALEAYERYSRSELEVIREVLPEASRSFYKCDPKQYVEGVTHTKLTRLLQGYIENEVNLNPYGTCRENCRYYTFTEYNGCFKEQFCANQPPCRGKVINCDYVDSDMKICSSSNPERRYDWVQYKRGKTLGNTGVCHARNLFKVDSWWRYLFWHCSYCLCLCDEGQDEKSDRYFNLRPVTSDIEENKVVTGVRIVKNNKIIHIQIQQGVLSSRGTVNKTSLSWKPVDNYTISQSNVENDKDYHTMSWLERALDTDEVFGPPEHVVTGIRFRKIGMHLNLEVRVTPINFTTGEVFTAQHSYWLGNDNTDFSADPRSEIKLTEPDIPIRNGPHFLNSKHNQYIQFQSSSFKTDVGQSTVPFLDSQTLVSEGAPISGIGLIHRGKSGSGGFIGLKLISYDYAPHLRFSEHD